MEQWLMDCLGFYCISVGVGVLLYLFTKAFIAISKYEANTKLKELEKAVEAKDEQIEGLRSIVEKLKQNNDSYDEEDNNG